MSEKLFRVRTKHRYDTVQNWTTSNPQLLTGEFAVTIVPSVEEGKKPSVLLKVGDGTSNYNDLPYLAAKAGDVYDWAKAETKPEYTASEIKDLDAYIADKAVDTNTQYQIVPGTQAKEFILQSKEKDATEWTNVYTLTIPPEITYTISSDSTGKLTLTPSEGTKQEITIIEVVSTKEDIVTGETKVPTAGAVADYVDDKLTNMAADLDYTDTPATGEFVTEVNEVDGVIEVKRAKPTVADISDLEFNTAYDKETNKAATMADIDAASARVLRFKNAVDTMADLPTSDMQIGDVYIVKKDDDGEEYVEYAWAEKEPEGGGDPIGYWEKLGGKSDLSAYVTKDELDDALDLKQDLISETNKLPVEFVTGVATATTDGLMSAADKDKLDNLQGGEGNKIEKIVAGDALLPITDKTVTLSKIAETGNVMDLIQDADNWLILDGGNSLGGIVEPSTLVLNGGTSKQS